MIWHVFERDEPMRRWECKPPAHGDASLRARSSCAGCGFKITDEDVVHLGSPWGPSTWTNIELCILAALKQQVMS